jgi:hypothetical protein
MWMRENVAVAFYFLPVFFKGFARGIDTCGVVLQILLIRWQGIMPIGHCFSTTHKRTPQRQPQEQTCNSNSNSNSNSNNSNSNERK